MKNKFLYFFLICLVFSVALVFAQTKTAALKFDEFVSSPYNTATAPSDYDRRARFINYLKKEPSTSRAVIIYYNARKGKFPLDQGKKEAEYVQQQIVSVNGTNNQVILVDGGYRDDVTLEFWIAQKNAELPTSTPTYEKADIVYCPEIRVTGDGYKFDKNEPLTFSIVLNGTSPDQKPKFEWNVSAGEITEGQGTDRIEVDWSKTSTKRIRGIVTIRNLSPECKNSDSASIEVGLSPILIDQFEHIAYSWMAARIDAFMIPLMNMPEATGYILIYGSRTKGKREAVATNKRIIEYVTFRRFDISRIVFVDGGYRDELFVQFYSVPPGVEPPKPNPTVDEKFVIPEKPLKKRPRKQ